MSKEMAGPMHMLVTMLMVMLMLGLAMTLLLPPLAASSSLVTATATATAMAVSGSGSGSGSAGRGRFSGRTRGSMTSRFGRIPTLATPISFSERSLSWSSSSSSSSSLRESLGQKRLEQDQGQGPGRRPMEQQKQQQQQEQRRERQRRAREYGREHGREHDRRPPSPGLDPAEYDGPTYRSNLLIAELASRASEGDAAAAYEAEDVLRKLERDGIADTISYNGVINAYAKSTVVARPKAGAGDGGSRDRDGSTGDSMGRQGGPGPITFRYIAYGDDDADNDDDDDSCPQNESMERAELVLQRMEDAWREQADDLRRWRHEQVEHRENAALDGADGPLLPPMPKPRVRVRPNVRTYTTLMDAYVRRMTPGRYRRHRHHDDDDDHDDNLSDQVGQEKGRKVRAAGGMAQTTGTRQTRRQRPRQRRRRMYGPDDVEAVLERMKQMSIDQKQYGDLDHDRVDCMNYDGDNGLDGGNWDINPNDTIHLDNIDDPDTSLTPNTITYNTVLNAYAKSGWGIEGAERATRLLSEMTEPSGVAAADVVSYNTVLDAWAKSGAIDAGRRAERILRRMIAEAETETETGAHTSKHGLKPRPNARSYTIVMDAYGRTAHDDPNSPRKAMSLLNELEQRYRETSNVDSRPGVHAYCSVMNAVARSRCLANVVKDGNDHGDDDHDDDGLPDGRGVKGIKGKAILALSMLRRMERLADTGENPAARPNIVAYNTVLNACAATGGGGFGVGDGGDSARGKGDYVSVMADERAVAMAIVKALYAELTGETKESSSSSTFSSSSSFSSSSLSSSSDARPPVLLPPPPSPPAPDHYTYGTILKACANLVISPVERHSSSHAAFLTDVLRRCAADGMVSFGVLYELRQAAPLELYRSLLPKDAVNAGGSGGGRGAGDRFRLDRIPKSWRRNVVEKRRRKEGRGGERKG